MSTGKSRFFDWSVESETSYPATVENLERKTSGITSTSSYYIFKHFSSTADQPRVSRRNCTACQGSFSGVSLLGTRWVIGESSAMSHRLKTNRKRSKVRKWPASYIRNGRATLEEFPWFHYFRYWSCLCPSWNVVILFRCDNSPYASTIGQFTSYWQEFWIETSLYKTHQRSARNSHRKTRTW